MMIGQGMLMMSGSRRPDINRPPRSTARPRNIRGVSLLGPGAGPSRWRRGPGPLPTLSMPRRVVTSLRPVTSISATPFTTAWSMAFRSLGPGRAIGPRSSHHRDAGWNCLRVLVTDLEGRPAESASASLRRERGGRFHSLRQILLPGRQGRRSYPLPTLLAPRQVTRPGFWRLSDPRWRSLRPRSSLCEQWWCDPLVPEGPLDREDRSTTDTLDESVVLDFVTWNLEGGHP